MDGDIDTVDQRWVQDQALMADMLQAHVFGGPLFPGVLGGTVQLLVLLIYAAAFLSGFVTGVVLVVLLVSLILTILLSAPYSRSATLVALAEGQYRFAHGRVREFAESIGS